MTKSWSAAMAAVYDSYQLRLSHGGVGRQGPTLEEFIRERARCGDPDAVTVVGLLRPQPDDIPGLEIEYESDNYLSFSVVGSTPEQEAEIERLDEEWSARLCKAKAPAERDAIIDGGTDTGHVLNWCGDTRTMAAELRRAADWLDGISRKFPGHRIKASVD